MVMMSIMHSAKIVKLLGRGSGVKGLRGAKMAIYWQLIESSISIVAGDKLNAWLGVPVLGWDQYCHVEKCKKKIIIFSSILSQSIEIN